MKRPLLACLAIIFLSTSDLDAEPKRPMTKVAAKKVAATPNVDLTGEWRLFLPAGNEREMTITRGEDGAYHFAPATLNFGGAYETKNGLLESVDDADKPRGQYFWKVKTRYLITTTKQTANVGADYTGAILFRSREDVAKNEE